MNRTLPLVLGILPGFLLLPVSGEAQTRLIPQVGLYATVSELGMVDTPEGAREVGEQESSLAYGLTLDFGSSNYAGLKITGIYGTDSEVPVGGIGCTAVECDLRSTLLGISGTIVLRPIPPGSPLRPYILGGGGIKKYDFEFQEGSQLKDAFGDDSKATGVLGIGFDWDLGLLEGNAELVDYVSDSVLEDGDLQHDFFLTVGLILG